MVTQMGIGFKGILLHLRNFDPIKMHRWAPLLIWQSSIIDYRSLNTQKQTSVSWLPIFTFCSSDYELLITDCAKEIEVSQLLLVLLFLQNRQTEKQTDTQKDSRRAIRQADWKTETDTNIQAVRQTERWQIATTPDIHWNWTYTLSSNRPAFYLCTTYRHTCMRFFYLDFCHELTPNGLLIHTLSIF
jgi:hypothetical protein